MRPSQAYTGIGTYLCRTSSSQVSRLVGSLAYDKNLVLGMNDFEEVEGEFKGVKVQWLHKKHPPNTKTISLIYGVNNPEKRYYTLTFHKRYQNLITESYLNHVLKECIAINMRNRQKKLYANEDDEWNQVTFQHPAVVSRILRVSGSLGH